ncbi:MAG: cytochrome c biogenesis protein ResB, partial [Candidatus Eisenbacteria bacterium]|nr:cytochrome c biogenesis protein ResB [Candidatus Eisenbacteria bacterium]
MRRLLADLYELLGNTGFAIAILIVLAAASIAGIVLVDQIPVRGEAARAAYAERLHEPLVWLLVNVVPDRPFRCPGYQALLALLSLSLLACTIKRWRRTWRLALRIGPAPDAVFDGAETVRWRTRSDAPDLAAGYLRRRLFRLHRQESIAAPGGSEGREIQLAASRFGLARLGPVFTHMGFLLLVVGAIVMGISGSSRMLWLRPGATAGVPGTDLALHLEDFRIETTPSGRVSAYVSTATLREGGRDVRSARIEVNKPLRHRGYSFYQNSYRQNPTRLAAIDIVTDAAPAAARATPGDPARPAVGPHGRAGQAFETPVTTRVPWGERVALPNSPFAVEIDTFLIDFVVGERGP